MTNAPTATNLMTDFSLEMTGKDIDDLDQAAGLIPAGTRVNVTFLGNEDLEMRLAASRSVLAKGLVPVPHISARRLTSRAELETYLGALRDAGAIDSVFAVGGDPSEPAGPYSDSESVIRSGLLAEYGVRRVSIAGYPEGHPDIADDVLWDALAGKADSLAKQGLEGTIITQFAFDEEPVFAWIEKVRDRGITLPIRIGVPGPAGVKRLVGFARRFGIGANAMIVKKYGFSLTNLMGTAGPDKLICALESGYDAERHGEVHLHFYTFGGLTATSEWIQRFGQN
ncbi:methylenetetrahydrofolate reductase (NADPH) [Microbacterium sp. cf046]|uniref:methylenetetrahydrofolate reductase n=1 Tax=Microbacterium sp. cf046 TaxID=1761803 RepID=UPI0008E64888|nr:methylenetetrahydrofolate reductase [Microbacterium sp. cf046]SFR89487.1 methylenetetrahydrofolate reductase (NADPH) [Microbacterium sp. cf046]